MSLAVGSKPFLAYVDEYGNHGFDFSAQGTSKRFVVCAVVVSQEDNEPFLDGVRSLARKNRYFQNGPLHNSKLGTNGQAWLDTLTRAVKLPFQIHVLVVDKTLLTSRGLIESRSTFWKFLHSKLDEFLIDSFRNISIVSDEHGTEEFMRGFKSYLRAKRETMELLRYIDGDFHDFRFVDDRESPGVQMADVFAKAFGYSYDPALLLPESDQIKAILLSKKPHITLYPETHVPLRHDLPWNSGERELDSVVAKYCYEAAAAYHGFHVADSDEKMQHQMRVLDILLQHMRYDDTDDYVSTAYLAAALRDRFVKEPDFDTKYVTRSIIPELRVKGNLIIASSTTGGYKIPTKLQDVYDYLNHCNSILVPMLRKLFLCHNEILKATTDGVSVLEKPEYVVPKLCYADFLENPSHYTKDTHVEGDVVTEDDI